ncbi:MAG: UDP-glucose 4-epimerase, partial [bacterium]
QSMQVFGNDYETKDGSGVRDYVHVSDLANAHVLAFEHLNIKKESTTINLGTGKGYSVLEVIQETEKVSGKKVNYQVVEKREGDPAGLYASYEKAKEVLNWEPRFSDLHTLIESTWNIYQIKNK